MSTSCERTGQINPDAVANVAARIGAVMKTPYVAAHLWNPLGETRGVGRIPAPLEAKRRDRRRLGELIYQLVDKDSVLV